VRAFKQLNFTTVAAGDSYNDVALLAEAEAGIFVHPPANVAAVFPQFPVTQSYAELEAAILRAAERL
jgi:phosphoserine/homoserine phosphotransferase